MICLSLASGWIAGAAELQPVRPPVLHLVDAGAPPRVRLALQPAAGHRSRVVATRQATTTSKISLVRDPPPTEGRTTQIISLSVDEVSADGAFTWSWTMLEHDVVVDPPPKRDRAARNAEIAGLSGTVRTSRTGLPIAATHSGSDDVDGAARAVSLLPTPVPEVDVGVGATWTVSDGIDLDALTIDTVTTWTVEAIDADSVTLQGIVRGGPSQTEVSLADVTATIDALDVQGTVRVVQPLTAVAPTRRDGTGSYSVDARARKGPLSIRFELDIEDRFVTETEG